MDILKLNFLKRLMKWRGFQFVFTLLNVLVFGTVILIALLGPIEGEENLGSILTWLFWWTLIPVTMLFAARIWCFACPWIAPADWIQRLAFWQKGKRSLTLNKKVPKMLRNFWIITLLFLILTWADFSYELVSFPRITAFIALGLTGFAIVISLIFEKRSFCKYFCPVGGVISAYANAAPLELRNKDDEVCRSCKFKACFKGSTPESIEAGGKEAYGCPMGLYPAQMDRNTYCLLCTECIKACPYDNVTIRTRKPFADLFQKGKQFLKSKDISFSLSAIVVLLLGIIPFENLIMQPAWQNIEAKIGEALSLDQMIVRTGVYILIMALALSVFYGIVTLVKKVSKIEHSPKTLFTWYALPFIPLAIAFHVSHNYFHIFIEGASILPALSDPFGLGWDLFGTAKTELSGFLSMAQVMFLQKTTIILGFLGSVYALLKLNKNLFENKKNALKALIIVLGLLIILGGLYFWLSSLPMEMRLVSEANGH